MGATPKRRRIVRVPYAPRKKTKTAARAIIRSAARSLLTKRRKRRSSTRLVMFNRLLQSSVRTRLTYCDTKTINAHAGADRFVFNLNYLHDPDQTGIGHQPCFFDRWKTLYNRYRVVGASWTIVFAPHRINSAAAFAAGGTASGETHPVSDTSAYNQNTLPCILVWEVRGEGHSGRQADTVDKNVLREHRTDGIRYRMTNANPHRTYKMSGRSSIKKILHNPEDADTTWQVAGGDADASAGRTRAMLEVGTLSKDGGNVASYRFDIRINYIVEFTEPVHEGEN